MFFNNIYIGGQPTVQSHIQYIARCYLAHVGEAAVKGNLPTNPLSYTTCGRDIPVPVWNVRFLLMPLCLVVETNGVVVIY